MFIINKELEEVKELKDLIDKVQSVLKLNIESIEQNSRLLSIIHKNMVKFNRFQEINETTQKKVDSYKSKVNTVARTNKVVEETVCNILLAVRQSGAYKAWIPEPYQEKK